MLTERYLWVTRESRLHHKGTFMPDTYTIHNTDNDAPAINERNNLQNNEGTTSFHSVLDEKEVIRCIQFNTGANHAGNYTGNMTSLSLEICSGALQKHFKQTWENAVEVVAYDLTKLGWGVDRLRQHNHWSGKHCPRYIRDRGLWDKFKEDVKNRMEEMKEEKKRKTDFEDARKWVIEKGISDGTRGNEPVTRSELWAMLYRANKKGVF